MTIWLVTGTSTGLGRALAEHLLEKGHQVVATARDTATVEELRAAHPDQVVTAALDVTDPASITAAVALAEQRFGGIDVLVNNAGYGYMAAVEEGVTDDVDRLFATNVFGPVELIKAALPGMRRRRSGTIVNVSSVGARITLPGGGYYSASKAALEALSGSLRKEIAPLGLHVVVVEPGALRTEFRGRSAARSATRLPAYDRVLGRTGDQRLGPQNGDPQKAAAAIVRAVEHPGPPKLLLLGTDALGGFDSAAREAAADAHRFERLTRSIDIDQ